MKYLKLNYEEIKNKYPNALKKVEDWFYNNPDIKAQLKQGKYNAKEELQVISNLVGMVLTHDPRKLYDVFDQLDIKISVFQVDVNEWAYYVNRGESYACEDRIEAEEKGLIKAFNTLENRLS